MRAVVTALHLTVYTGSGCCLCDEAKVELDRIAPGLGITVEYVDITGDAALEAEHRTQIPVGFMDGCKVFKYRVDAGLLERRVTGTPGGCSRSGPPGSPAPEG